MEPETTAQTTKKTAAPDAEMNAYKRLDVDIVAGEGTRVIDSEGREYLDLYGGHATSLLGHGHPALLEALTAQAETLFFQTNLVNVPVRGHAHEALVDFAPDGLDAAFLVNSGAEAIENALRLTFRATGKSKVVVVEGGFHGRTAAAAACTAGSARWYGFPRTPFDTVTVPRGDVGALEAAIGEDVAAFLVEAVQGVAGAVDLPTDFLVAARDLCTKHGALFIADEIQCGMGRCGTPFAIEQAGITPDLLTTAKGLAGGFPAGAVLAGAEVASIVGPGDLGTTFGGGPLACALIATVIETLNEEQLVAHAARLGGMIADRCRVGPVVDVQGRGLLVGLRTKVPARNVLPALRAKGILAGGAADPDIVRLMPPLTLQESDIDTLAKALASLEVTS